MNVNNNVNNNANNKADNKYNTDKVLKSFLVWGLAMLALGLGLFLAADRLSKPQAFSLGCGFCGASAGILWRFFYWRRHRLVYDERLRQERIRAGDEMLVLLRRQAGHLTYQLTVALLAGLTLLAALSMGLGLWLPMSRYVFYLALIALAFEYVCGIVIFNLLKKRY